MLDPLPDYGWSGDPVVNSNFQKAEKQINEILPFQTSNFTKCCFSPSKIGFRRFQRKRFLPLMRGLAESSYHFNHGVPFFLFIKGNSHVLILPFPHLLIAEKAVSFSLFSSLQY